MASTILYKFRSGTNFEALPLPGSAARLFDVKKAIVKAKKLDTGSMEFDLAVRNADSGEEYVNESMLLPRGTRLIVQRLPAARGHGFLVRMARNEHAGGGAATSSQHHHQQQATTPGTAPSGFYTIDSRARDDDDEFVQSGVGDGEDEEKELAALQAVTNLRPSDGPAMTGGYSGSAGGRGGPSHGGPGGPGGPGRGGNFKPNFRPNADPELREQERKLMPKKRATGIPRTFLNLSAPPQTDGNKEGGENESSVPLLQPNTLGFEELVNRGGGQSENASGTRRDLDYALKLTATEIPDYLQCGICHGVVKNAMLLPWDPEGRTACETCIRDALTQNGFRCPLTGMDGVSPDDLHPNAGLRKAAELFIKGVMEKIDEIERQQVDEAEENAGEMAVESAKSKILEGDGTEKGVILSKRTTIASRKKTDDDDPFGGGDDDFGGDVFAVETEKQNDEEDAAEGDPKEEEAESKDVTDKSDAADLNAQRESDNINQNNEASDDEYRFQSDNALSRDDKDLQISTEIRNNYSGGGDDASHDNKSSNTTPNNHRDRREPRRRGPPVGYAMGPAGGAVGSPHGRNERGHQHNNNGYHGGRGDDDVSEHGGPGDYGSSSVRIDHGGRGGRSSGRGHGSPSGGGRNSGFHGFNDRTNHRGRGGRGRGRGRFGNRGEMDGGRGNSQSDGTESPHHTRVHGEDDSRGHKRSWDEHHDVRWEQPPPPPRQDHRMEHGGEFRGGRGGPRDFQRHDGRGRGRFRGGGRGRGQWERGGYRSHGGGGFGRGRF